MADLENRIRITKFDGTDFSLWKDKIINALKASDCEDSIKEAFKLEGDEDVLKGLIKKDEKAKLILMSSIQDNILRKLPRKEAKQIWKALHEKYEDKNTQNIIFVRRRFLNMKQETNETIEDYIDRFEMLKEELEVLVNTSITDEDAVMTILSGLSSQYDNFVQCLVVNKKDLKLADIISNLKCEEKRRLEKRQDKVKSSDTEQVFFSKGKNNKKQFKKKFHKGIICYNCNIEGHYAADCHKPKRNKDKKINFSVKENMKEDDKDNDANFLFQTYKTVTNRNTWFFRFWGNKPCLLF
jgi:hypothetical protein